MNQSQFQMAANISAELAARWYPVIKDTFDVYGITQPVAQAMFIAQVGHESAGFSHIVESFNYSQNGLKATFGHRLSADQISMLGRQPGEKSVPLNRQAAIANLVYGGRMGNKAVGDGWNFRGRGLIQVTGATNYMHCGAVLGLDLTAKPELLEQDIYAMRSAAWFWNSRKCGAVADDVVAVTRLINGGSNGLADRRERFERARQVLV
ncbi:glycoside hydrolase family 19 protein [Pectobacterium carotovorum]|uniref:glycoside hydrolase family 19 protein n=1 Tax=Pectobacterium carotovorum TaxID=554 RepID=UPI0037FB89D5